MGAADTGRSAAGDPPIEISVVIPTIDRGPAIVDTVTSVFANAYPSFEVLVADQSIDRATEDALAPWVAGARIRYFRHPRTGVAMNRNLGAWRARGSILVYVDDDCVASPTLLAEIARVFAGDARIGMVFGDVRAAPHDQRCGFVQAYRRTRAGTATRPRHKHRVEGIGACMAVRKRVWEALAGFDLDLGAGAKFRAAEDTDLALRVLLAGHHVHETPSAWVVHHGFRTWEQRPAMLHAYLFGLGALCGKHLRAGRGSVLWLLAAYAYRWLLAEPVVEIGPRPPRGPRLAAFARGLVDGAAARVDPIYGVFRRFEPPMVEKSPRSTRAAVALPDVDRQ